MSLILLRMDGGEDDGLADTHHAKKQHFVLINIPFESDLNPYTLAVLIKWLD